MDKPAQKKAETSAKNAVKSKLPLPKVRLLPLFILAGALMFGARIGSLWQKSTSPDDPSAPMIQQQAFIPTALAESSDPTDTPNDSGEGLGGEEIVTQNSGKNAGNSGGGGFTQSEIQVLQQLAERREAIETRERELDQRLAVLSAAESQIDSKIKKLREIQSTIEDLMEKHDVQESKKIDNLVKIYQSMKPKDAARIFEQMDMPILVRVINGMKQRTSAAILAKMSSDRANAVTEVLANQTQLPSDLIGEAGIKKK